jgi:hypothetical protein
LLLKLGVLLLAVFELLLKLGNLLLKEFGTTLGSQ